MGRYRIPDDSEVQALLDKERREQEQRNKRLLGNPEETMEEVQIRSESDFIKSLSGDLSGEYQQGVAGDTITGKTVAGEIVAGDTVEDEGASGEAMPEWSPEHRQSFIKSTYWRYGVRLVFMTILLGLAVVYQQWAVALFAVMVVWGQSLGFTFWKGMPQDKHSCNKYIIEKASDRQMSLYLSLLGGFFLLTTIVYAIVGKFLAM